MGRYDTGYGTRPIAVPATTAPNSVDVITSPCRLAGWSLAAGNLAPGAKRGTITSPAAGAVVLSFGTVPAGEYILNWQVELSGTLAVADQDNFAVSQAGSNVVVSVNEPTANVFQQEPITILIPAGGATLRILANALGTVGAVYTAQATLTQVASAQATITDGGTTLGQVGLAQGFSDTQIMPEDGVYVASKITISVQDGTLQGCIWVKDFVDPEPC